MVDPSAYGDGGAWTSVSGSPSGSEEPLSIEASATHMLFAGTMTFFARAIGGWLGGSHDPRQALDTVSVYGLLDGPASTGTSCTSIANWLLPAGRSNEYVSGPELETAGSAL